MRNASGSWLHFVKDGVTESFPPGAEFPVWAEPLITNPLVLGNDGPSDDPKGSSDGPPPHAGKGSGEAPWTAYAAAHDVDLSGVTGRDEIIAACEKAGVEV